MTVMEFQTGLVLQVILINSFINTPGMKSWNVLMKFGVCTKWRGIADTKENQSITGEVGDGWEDWSHNSKKCQVIPLRTNSKNFWELISWK